MLSGLILAVVLTGQSPQAPSKVLPEPVAPSKVLPSTQSPVMTTVPCQTYVAAAPCAPVKGKVKTVWKFKSAKRTKASRC